MSTNFKNPVTDNVGTGADLSNQLELDLAFFSDITEKQKGLILTFFAGGFSVEFNVNFIQDEGRYNYYPEDYFKGNIKTLNSKFSKTYKSFYKGIVSKMSTQMNLPANSDNNVIYLDKFYTVSIYDEKHKLYFSKDIEFTTDKHKKFSNMYDSFYNDYDDYILSSIF